MKSSFEAPALPLPNPHDWCDAREAAKIIGCSKTYVFQLLGMRRLVGYKIGSVRLLWRDDVNTFAAAYQRVRRAS